MQKRVFNKKQLKCLIFDQHIDKARLALLVYNHMIGHIFITRIWRTVTLLKVQITVCLY